MGKQTAQLKRDYHDQDTKQVDAFVVSLKENLVGADTGTFDSAGAAEYAKTMINQDHVLPEGLKIVLDEAGDKAPIILRAVLDGISCYETAHGVNAPADLVEQAIHNAYCTSSAARSKFALDSANSLHQDNLSLQPNRAVVAIIPIMAEAIPFAHYLPADIGSNQAKCAILSHVTKDTYGGYASGALLDGTGSGESYIDATRIHKCAIDGSGNFSGKITVKQSDAETCDAAAAVPPLLRGRSIVYVNGSPVAFETKSTGSGNSAISGEVTIGSTTYLIGGSINTDTGVIAGTTTPAIPNTTPLHVEAYIDYERNPALIPAIITNVDTYDYYANSWRVSTFASMDGRTQMANELGLDPYSEGVYAINAQYANERHYRVLRQARRLATQNTVPYSFEWTARSPQMSKIGRAHV